MTDGLVEELKDEFGLKRTLSLEFSVWFSYGSNLDPSYFDQKLTERGSTLTLYGAMKSSLDNFQRLLDNRSEGHGLGYAIHCRRDESVQGIVHLVPAEDLTAFLRMEGVVNRKGEVSNNPSYKIIEITVKSEEESIPAFSLEGNKYCIKSEREERAVEFSQSLEEYIMASENGARTQGVDPTQFTNDFNWLKNQEQITKSRI